ncbi:hypothetical protein vseg_006123 [Gypsophila vaccaria]
MMSGLICGTSVLPRDEEDGHERKTRSANSSPRKSRSSKTVTSTRHGNNNKNPYSTRGLDRFSALLSEIEQERQKIYSQVNPNEISLVRFVYTDDHEFKPIIVKAKQPKNTTINNDNDQRKKKPKIYMAQKSLPTRKCPSFSSSSMATKEAKDNTFSETTTKKSLSRIMYRGLWNNCSWVVEPKIYLAMIIIMIMVFLLAFNKSFAIMCTSIGWYMIPNIMNNSNSTTKSRISFKKKDGVSMPKLSNKKVVLREGTKSFKHPRERVFGCQTSS